MNMTFPSRMHFSHSKSSTHSRKQKKKWLREVCFPFPLVRKLFVLFLLLHFLTKATTQYIEQLGMETDGDIAHLFPSSLLQSNFHLPLILFQPLTKTLLLVFLSRRLGNGGLPSRTYKKSEDNRNWDNIPRHEAVSHIPTEWLPSTKGRQSLQPVLRSRGVMMERGDMMRVASTSSSSSPTRFYAPDRRRRRRRDLLSSSNFEQATKATLLDAPCWWVVIRKII